ncbi:hypothetical protein [Amycolatopsis sp. NBRC 101858]|nr:hypothetical protein [Amycolatopsis sp. NBRC 101858]
MDLVLAHPADRMLAITHAWDPVTRQQKLRRAAGDAVHGDTW